MELLDICLTTTYVQSEVKFYQQKQGMALGNSLSPTISNIFMEYFVEIPLDIADHKPAKWLRYIDDTFVVWSHGSARLQQFLHHYILPFLDVLYMKRSPKMPTQVYRKPIHTGCYLHF
jgi:hypothetical protein